MSEFSRRLVNRIDVTGPMTIAEYMTECLLHPEFGYYATKSPIGGKGDFVTAPEISQMFGECIGLALAQAWRDQGSPTPFAVVELGPGRGTLMSDMLRATRSVPGFHSGLELHLVEAARSMRDAQAHALAENEPTWHSDVSTLPDAPLFLIANEFFDALPVRQFIRDGDEWRERVIGCTDGELQFGLTDPMALASLDPRLRETDQGDIVELSKSATGIAQEIGARVAQFGGAAYIIDYGHWGSFGDTFQAVQGHTKVDPLSAPGEVDLTARVDFRAIAVAAASGAHSNLTPQGVFLERLGITERAKVLARDLQSSALETHIAAHRRLTHPDEMGSLFRVLALYPANAPVPPGVDP